MDDDTHYRVMCIVGRERKLFAELSDVCLSLQEALVRIDYILQLAKQQYSW